MMNTKTNSFDKAYLAPSVEVLNFIVEEGFANSWGDGSIDDDWNDNGIM